MRLHSDVSRRHMLAISAAAGGLAIGSGFRGASAQAGKRIERLDPSLDAIIDTSQPVQELASGLGGPLGPAEGPVWWKEGRYLLFSDIHNDRRIKYTPGQGVTVFNDHTNRANGLTRDLQGRLVACEHDTRRVTRQEPDGSITVIANSFQGRSLNRQYRRKPYATNVLSFSYAKDRGDVVLCHPVIAREARAQRKTLAAHYAHLVLHGLLHLRGYEHEKKREAERMERIEIRLLARAGFGNPYTVE